jgi:hypothetical protein
MDIQHNLDIALAKLKVASTIAHEKAAKTDTVAAIEHAQAAKYDEQIAIILKLISDQQNSSESSSESSYESSSSSSPYSFPNSVISSTDTVSGQEKFIEFGSHQSLVQHTNFGDGIIRHIVDNKAYHGKNNHTLAQDKPDHKMNPNGKLLHCFYEYKNKQQNLPNRCWDTHDHTDFCKNCEEVNKFSRSVTFWRCLGH